MSFIFLNPEILALETANIHLDKFLASLSLGVANFHVTDQCLLSLAAILKAGLS